MQLNPDATFDCLFVGHRLQARVGSFANAELHLFAYLSCLLWLFRRRIVADWGYEFVGTELGAPFSRHIDLAVTELLGRGYFFRAGDRLYMSKMAERRLADFGALSLNRDRAECLDASCSSTVAFSVGMVASALAQEPELKHAKALPANRLLLDEPGRSQIYEHFEALRAGLGRNNNDLRLPAVIWLAALYRAGESPDAL
jgi:hypothetical protein